MVIKINYTSSDVYVSTSVSPVYVVVNYSAVNNGGGNFVPYTGATGDVDLGEYELKAGQLTLDTTQTGTAAVGTTRWNDTIGSSETTLKGGSVILKNGVDLVARVVNKVTPNTTLTKAAYQAVRVSGAQGQRLAVALAQANNDANSADTIGLVTETIATNQEGFIMTVGQLENINTTGSLQGETWADGDVLYLSPTTAGVITKVKPTGNGHIVVIGYVEYAHANNGKIYVKVMNGWELDELHDVAIVSPANNEALIYESSTSLWKNKTIATALGYTPISGSGATGQIAYWNGTSSQTGSNNLFWDAANSRLGINTTSPIRALDIRGAARIETASTTELDLIGGGGNILRVSCSATTPFIGTMTSNPLGFFIGATERARFFTTGNLGINTGSTDSGQRLQVMGDAFIRGSGATSATTGLTVQDSGGLNLFRIRNDGRLDIGTNGGETCIQPTQNGTTTNKDGRGLIYSVAGMIGAQAAHTFTVNGGILNGGGYLMRLSTSFSPTTGSVDTTFLWVTPTINQTGGTHITRGLYVNPTLTAAADWRSIEWSNNSGWGLYGAGTSRNFLGGNLHIGTASSNTTSAALIIKNITGGTDINHFLNFSTILSDVTSSAKMFVSYPATQATSFTLQNLTHFYALQQTLGSGSVVTNQYGFSVDSSLVGATNNYGFYGNIPNGTNRWNLYLTGADNYIGSKLLIGTTTVSTFALDVNGTARVSGSLTMGLGQTIFWGSQFVLSRPGSIGVSLSTGGSQLSIVNSANTSSLLTILNTGEATFSSSLQVGGGTINASAILQTDSTTKGFLPPRMTTTQKNAISSPAAGLQVYDTTLNQMSYYNGTTWVNF